MKTVFGIDESAGEQPGRRERKRTETRQRIFRAAMNLFAERGFFDTTVEDITEAADVGKGTFFNYFPSKEHVLGVLHDLQLSKAEQARAEAEARNLPTRELLLNLMKRIAEEPGRSQLLARSLLGTVLTSEAVREMLLDVFARGRKVLVQILQMAQGRGEVRRDLTAEQMARTFQQNLLGTVLLWSISAPAQLNKQIEMTFEIYWCGIRAVPPTATESEL